MRRCGTCWHSKMDVRQTANGGSHHQAVWPFRNLLVCIMTSSCKNCYDHHRPATKLLSAQKLASVATSARCRLFWRDIYIIINFPFFIMYTVQCNEMTCVYLYQKFLFFELVHKSHNQWYHDPACKGHHVPESVSWVGTRPILFQCVCKSVYLHLQCSYSLLKIRTSAILSRGGSF